MRIKKIILSLFLVATFVGISIGQNDVEPKQKPTYQLGFDIGPLIKTLTNKIDFRTNAPMGIISFKIIQESGFAFRSGIGFRYNKEKIDGGSDDAITYFGQMWMGFEKQKKVTKRWDYYVGGDINVAGSKFPNIFLSGGQINSGKTISFRFSPLIGFQYRLTPRILLQTEARLNFFYIQSYDSSTIIDDQPVFVDPFLLADSKSKGISISLPNILNLVVEL